MYTKVYPIEDLIMEIPDFTDAPTFDLSSLSQQNNSGGGVEAGASAERVAEDLAAGEVAEAVAAVDSWQRRWRQPIRPKPKPRQNQAGTRQELIDLIRATIQPDVWMNPAAKPRSAISMEASSSPPHAQCMKRSVGRWIDLNFADSIQPGDLAGLFSWPNAFSPIRNRCYIPLLRAPRRNATKA